MKTTIIACLISGLLLTNLAAQQTTFPDVDLLTIDGFPISASTITNDSLPMVLMFWKTYDQESKNHLLLLNETYENILKDMGIKFIAICVDCIGKTDHIKPFVDGNDIDVEVYIDKNGDFERSMCVSYSPFTILYDQNMDVVCQYAGYCVGSEDMLCEKVKNCLAGLQEED